MSLKVVTRFAPSPTGYLHVGGARTALFSWLLAKHHSGQFLLRIEDTDLARSTQAACEAVIEDLAWLGLHHDNPGDGLVYQSKRVDIYNKLIDDLLTRGLAYPAYESSEELETARNASLRRGRQYVYRRVQYTQDQTKRFEDEGRVPVIRFQMPLQEWRFSDAVLGKDVILGPDQVGDFVIRKTDGMPTYHFAVVVDDAQMGVSHILRGQEHLLNTHNHIALQEALGFVRPIYGHLPVILNADDGSKMSKRDQDKAVRHRASIWLKAQGSAAGLAEAASLPADRIEQWLTNADSQLDPSEHRKLMPVIGMSKMDLPEVLVRDFRANGYLPEVLNNFMALLGWSTGDDTEHMSIDELIQRFDIDGIGKSNAKFDRVKLLSFNTTAVNEASPQRLLSGFKNFLAMNPESPIAAASDEQLARLLEMNRGFRTFREVDDKCQFFFQGDEAISYDPKAVDKFLAKSDGQGIAVLRDHREALARIEPWTASQIEEQIKAEIAKTGLGLGKVAQPLRVAVSGSTVSPPIFDTLELLGRERTLSRIDRCLATVG